MTAESVTRAEFRARAMADRLRDAGFRIDIVMEHQAAEYYSSGDVMFPARVLVSVTAKGPRSWDSSYTFTFLTRLPAAGHHASTRYIGGHVYRPLMRGRQYGKRAGLGEMRSYISSEAANARDRADAASRAR